MARSGAGVDGIGNFFANSAQLEPEVDEVKSVTDVLLDEVVTGLDRDNGSGGRPGMGGSSPRVGRPGMLVGGCSDDRDVVKDKGRAFESFESDVVDGVIRFGGVISLFNTEPYSDIRVVFITEPFSWLIIEH